MQGVLDKLRFEVFEVRAVLLTEGIEGPSRSDDSAVLRPRVMLSIMTITLDIVWLQYSIELGCDIGAANAEVLMLRSFRVH